MRTEVSVEEIGQAVGLGDLILLLVAFLCVVESLIWTPIGVAIGFHPRFARILQPVVQFAASFLANFLFPAATILFLHTRTSLD